MQLGARSVCCCERHLGMSFSQWHTSEWHTWYQGMWISILQGNSKLFPRHLYQFTRPPQCIRLPSLHSLQPLKLSDFFTYASQTGKIVSPIVVFICIFLVTVQVKYLYFLMLSYTLADFFKKGFTSHSVLSNQSQRKEHSHREKKDCLLAQYSWFFYRMDYDFTVMLCVPYWYVFQNGFFKVL